MPKYIVGARAHDYGRGTAEQILSKIKSDGWECTQMSLKRTLHGINDYADITLETVNSVQQAMKKVPMQVSVLGNTVELGAINEEVRLKSVSDFISQIPVCKTLNISCIGSETTAITKQPIGSTYEEAQKQLLKSVDAIMPIAEQYGVSVGLEPVWYHSLNTVETINRVLKAVNSPNLKIIFDPANLISMEWVNHQDVLYKKSMECFGELITAVHIKGICIDNNGLHSCQLQDSILDYQTFFDVMADLPQLTLPIIREEVDLANVSSDQNLIKKFL